MGIDPRCGSKTGLNWLAVSHSTVTPCSTVRSRSAELPTSLQVLSASVRTLQSTGHLVKLVKCVRTRTRVNFQHTDCPPPSPAQESQEYLCLLGISTCRYGPSPRHTVRSLISHQNSRQAQANWQLPALAALSPRLPTEPICTGH